MEWIVVTQNIRISVLAGKKLMEVCCGREHMLKYLSLPFRTMISRAQVDSQVEGTDVTSGARAVPGERAHTQGQQGEVKFLL